MSERDDFNSDLPEGVKEALEISNYIQEVKKMGI